MSTLVRALSGMVGWAPIVVVLVVGIVIAARTLHEHPRRAWLTIGGAAAILLGDVLRMLWSYLLIPRLFEADLPVEARDVIFAVVSIFFSLIDAVGLGLLVWAIFVRAPDPPTHAFS